MTQDNSNNEVDGFKNNSFLTTCESWNMNSNYQEWHNTTSNDTEERIALRIVRWRNLSSLEKNLDERFEKEINPWWTIMYSLHEETPVTKE